MKGVDAKNWREKTTRAFSRWIFPLGVFIFLTGFFWVGDHGRYSKLFYWFLLLPSVVFVVLRPRAVLPLLSSRIATISLIFGAYMVLSALWLDLPNFALGLFKPLLFVLLFFCTVFEFGKNRPDLLRKTLRASGIMATWAAALTLTLFYHDTIGGRLTDYTDRLTGYGALYNPLLVSHVFGFFNASWLGFYFLEQKTFKPFLFLSLALCGGLLLATGSRTPMVATAFTVLWLSALSANRKSLHALGVIALLGTWIAAFAPKLILQRGLSYRTEIWRDVLRQSADALWFGHGYETPLVIQLAELPHPLSDPHNLSLSVLYAGGGVGLLLWVLIYAFAFAQSWRWRNEPWVLLCSGLVVYGLAAGMTEGGPFLNRPEEHWFLIWIPLALLAEAVHRAKVTQSAKLMA